MKNIFKNWKTSLVGVGILITLSGHAAKDPKILLDEKVLATAAAGVGLILSKDGDKTGTAK